MLRKASANSSRGPLALLVGLASLAFVLSAFRGASVRAAADAAPHAPPSAPVRSATDEYFGTKVVVPYRYMEKLKDPQVEARWAQRRPQLVLRHHETRREQRPTT